MYKCKYCCKEFASPQKLGGHIIRCKGNPKAKDNIVKCNNFYNFNHKKRKKDKNIYYCQYCGKECVGKNSLVQHEIRCNKNNNRINIVSNFILYNKNRKPINQFIKALNLGLPIPKVSDETKEKLRLSMLGRKLTSEIKQKIKETICENIKNDNWHNQFTPKIEFDGELYDSSWEIEFAKYLRKNNINFIRNNSTSFEYIWNNDKHNYFPDFYLPDYDLYIEIKGLWNERDICKWEQFPNKLDIYDSKDLYELGIISSYDKRILIDEKFRKKHIQI